MGIKCGGKVENIGNYRKRVRSEYEEEDTNFEATEYETHDTNGQESEIGETV